MTAVAPWELLPRLTTRGVAAIELDDWGVPDEAATGYRIVSGSPSIRGRVLWVAVDRRCASGLWECWPGIVGGTFLFNEVDVFLTGRMTVRDSNGTASRSPAVTTRCGPSGGAGTGRSTRRCGRRS